MRPLSWNEFDTPALGSEGTRRKFSVPCPADHFCLSTNVSDSIPADHFIIKKGREKNHFSLVMERNLVSDSNVSKHLGFFRENKKAQITSGLFRIFFFTKHFGEMGERREEKWHLFISCVKLEWFFFSPLFLSKNLKQKKNIMWNIGAIGGL